LAGYLFSVFVSGLYDFSAIPVVWSLWCEAIYYLLYPFIFIGITRFGFKSIFALASFASLLLSLTPDEGNGHAWNYGPFLTWIIFLPVWLSGVWISENLDLAKRAPKLLRTKAFASFGGIGIFILSVLWTIFRFHVDGGIKYPLYMMLVFSCFGAGYIFLIMQIDLSKIKIIAFFDRQGRWSYSLYLVHYPILYLVTIIMIKDFGVADLSQRLLIFTSFIVLLLAYFLAVVFYWLVEKPSHELAKQMGLKARSFSKFTISRAVLPAEFE
jgi:peptidoglycan/LPS O-acetylase OafA/YrhL